MALHKIRLELARDPQFPGGSAAHGYEIIVPLGPDGRIDSEEWRRVRRNCRVRRFWQGESDEEGHLVHLRGGTWAFHYDVEGNPEDDEAGFRFDTHRFLPGEYVSLLERDGEMRTFRVVSVLPIVAPQGGR